ncbi:hypothetical protein ACPC54_07330 [Kitasatospora sp. NPDC094028]
MIRQTIRRRARILAAVAVAALVAVAVSVWQFRGDAADAGAPRPSRVAGAAQPTVTVTRGELTEVVTLHAVVGALPQFSVNATASGPLARTAVGPGQAVAAGQQLFSSGGSGVAAPAAGTFVKWLVAEGAPVSSGVPVAVVAYAGFAETASVPPDAAYRLLDGRISARAMITGGPGPFDCALVQAYSDGAGAGAGTGSGAAAGPAGAPAAGGVPVVCAIPPDVPALAGLTGTVAVKSATVKDALLLPVEAVAGAAAHGEVSRVDPRSGKAEVVKVGLGISNGTQIQVTEGLAQGDVVLGTAPPLDARLP